MFGKRNSPMPADEALRTFAAKIGAPPRREEPEPDTCDDCGAFGWLRGRERALMLELRFKTGNVVALAYAWLERVEYDPSEALMLTFGRQLVKLEGSGLAADIRPNMSLLQGLVRQRITWICESGNRTLPGAHATDVAVTRITLS
jgi:hypothetical protein